MTDKKKGFFSIFKKEEETKAEPSKPVQPSRAAKEKIEEAKVEVKKEAAEIVNKYVVVSGDTLSSIAKKYYNDAGKYLKIYEANKALIGDDPNLITPGMELIIPHL